MYQACLVTQRSGENGVYVRGEEKVDGATYYDYDVEKAKQILDDAGWTVGSDGIREKMVKN